MIVKLTTSISVKGTARYNDQKVDNGEASVLLTKNFVSEKLAARESFRSHVLELYASFNPRISKPGVHFVLAFSPQETVSDEKLSQIGQEFMDKMGFGKQPYVIYRHHDTAHPHAHIVSVLVDGNGNKVSEDFIKHRCNTARKELEIAHNLIKAEEQNQILTISSTLPEHAIHYGQQETKKAIGNVVQTAMRDYSFSRLEEFSAFIGAYNVQMNVLGQKLGSTWKGITFQLTDEEKTPLSPSVKASSYHFAPTLDRLENRFRSGSQKKAANRPALLKRIERSMRDFQHVSEVDFKAALRDAGIQVLEQNDSYVYVDHQKRAVYSENELGPMYTYRHLHRNFVEESVIRESRIYPLQTPTNTPVRAPAPTQAPQPTLSVVPPPESPASNVRPPAPVNPPNPTTPEERRRLGKLVSESYQDYKKETNIFFESSLINAFPFEHLRDQLIRKGHSPAVATGAVSEFERYKREQFPQIISREISYFEQQAGQFLKLAMAMPIPAESRITFLERMGFVLTDTGTEGKALTHPSSSVHRMPIAPADYGKLVARSGAPVPIPQTFSREEKAALLAAATGKSIEGVSPYTVRVVILKSLLPPATFETLSKDLNRAYLQQLPDLSGSAGTGGIVEALYTRGIVLNTAPGSPPTAGFYNTPPSSFVVLSETLQRQLEQTALPADYTDRIQALNTPVGRTMVLYQQALDSKREDRQRQLEKQLVERAPELQGQNGAVLLQTLFTTTVGIKQPQQRPIEKKEERRNARSNYLQSLLWKDYPAARMQKGYFYESSLLRNPADFPTSRLVSYLNAPPHSVGRAEAEAVVANFKAGRLKEAFAIEQKDTEHFARGAKNMLNLLADAPLQPADRLALLRTMGYPLEPSAEGTLRFTYPGDSFIRYSPNAHELKRLQAEPAIGLPIKLPGNGLPAAERTLYEKLANGEPMMPVKNREVAPTFYNMDIERVRAVLECVDN
ncbi:relaxase/mobilization nuclease domain-containing protein [Rudanella paleaurantiibacter]|uniref:Relaxase/mobilization nuclease domain-containing protein n=1 Tax=Rudanella paleaurantiibacter TaxID=2614655 RepID=A0A7J5TT61_9BACT|nr:relaxase/mobilization nuclease domain-containing protein [Rudanella paleaurantiibacter]KAB7726894.1 relaxase/mobilization nuclease domain-containing protein [Rudanella paleaurantiibacter]